MSRKGTVRFSKEFDPGKIDGIPVVEQAMEIEIGACSICGADQDGVEGGALDNVRIENGVLVGDAICVECLEAELGNDVLLDFIAGRSDG